MKIQPTNLKFRVNNSNQISLVSCEQQPLLLMSPVRRSDQILCYMLSNRGIFLPLTSCILFVLLVDWGKQCKYYICFLWALSISFVIVREDHKNYTFKKWRRDKSGIYIFILHIFDICQCANWLKWTWRLPLLAVLRQLCALFVTSSSKNRVETSLCSRLGQATGTGDGEEVSPFP